DELEGAGTDRFVDGLVPGPLGRRYARGRRDGSAGRDLARSRRRFPHQPAPRRRTLHAGQPISPDVRGDHRRSRGVHAAVENPVSAVPPDGAEHATGRGQVGAVPRGAPVREISQAGWRREMMRRLAVVAVCLVSLSLVAGAQGPSAAAKQSARATPTTGKARATARTPWGDPDLQGIWNDATSTPLQR